MAETREQWEKEVIGRQPAYNTRDEAVRAALKKMQKERIYEVWQEPGDGRFLVCEPQSFETLYRKDYKRVYTTGDLADMMTVDEIEEVKP